MLCFQAAGVLAADAAGFPSTDRDHPPGDNVSWEDEEVNKPLVKIPLRHFLKRNTPAV